MLNKILVAVDGSAASGRAVAMAAGIAARMGAALVLLHVQSDADAQELAQSRASFTELEHTVMSPSEMARMVGEGVLRAAQVQARNAGAQDVSVLLAQGDPGRVIVEHVQTHGIDLIVTGRRGLGRVRELLLGSVSHRVTQLAPCACMTVA